MTAQKQAFTLARQAGVMTVLDGDITPQDISELVALSDHAAFSEPGLARLTGMSEAIDALKKAQMLTNGHVYVTRGSEGCKLVGKSGGTPPNRVLPWRWWILLARAMFFMAHWHLAWQADTPSKRLSDSPAALPR
ncbi:putative sugar kinase [Salmonella enterica subsp. enterica]|uniref:Putative sugar kinase n=1 Tax=Salmonella enterica I TaxID=59201 RepID=A0A447TQY7_SALET|nr:putative sugar kinase [Salmonella enterica subsp. enterica]